jgi:hypothetical protein
MLVVTAGNAVAPSVVDGGWLARTQEAGTAGAAGGGSSAARADEDVASRRQGRLECDGIHGGGH